MPNNALERISAGRTFLSARIPFLGFMSLQLRPRLTLDHEMERVKTAAVGPDGTMLINPDYMAGLTEPEVRGLIAHEVLHPSLLFWMRMAGRPLKAWNWAHDHAINLIITEFAQGRAGGQIVLPRGGLLDMKYSGMSAEEIFETLPERAKKDESDGGSITIGGTGLDCLKDLASTPGGQKAARGDTSELEKLERSWQVATVAAAQVHEAQKGRGSLPGSLRLMIDDMLNPKQHWSDIISQWIGENAGSPDLTYMRPSRRSSAVGEILIGRRRKSYPDVTIFWDTSGSMSGEEKKVFPEVKSICEELDLTLRVIIIDSAIHADLENVKEAEEIVEALSGGGGSNFIPAFERLDEERNDSVVIAFTDGWIGVPETQPETLKGVVWVITSGGSDPTRGKWGQVLRLDDDENGEWE